MCWQVLGGRAETQSLLAVVELPDGIHSETRGVLNSHIYTRLQRNTLGVLKVVSPFSCDSHRTVHVTKFSTSAETVTVGGGRHI